MSYALYERTMLIFCCMNAFEGEGKEEEVECLESPMGDKEMQLATCF